MGMRGDVRFARWAALAAAVTAGACGGGEDRPAQPPGWDDGIRLPVAADLNPDPHIVEVALDAQATNLDLVPGGLTPMWTYNGLLPGPLIRATRGDRVIVHFQNHLPESTTIHWHGLRIPVAMDGMPGPSQPPIEPQGAFDYDFVVPDASTFWYHPHVNSAAQLGDGLYGPFIVDEPADAKDVPKDLGDEVVLVLSDVGVDRNGALEPPNSGGDLGTLFGREGDVLLVNGRVMPTLKARPGLRQRWRIINAARSRYFQLSFPGHSFVRIGGDGGLMAAPVPVERPVLAPAERADLLVVPNGEPGSDLVVQWVAFDRGYGTAFNRPPQDMFVVHLEGSPAVTPPMPVISRAIAPLPTEGATSVDLDLTMTTGTPLTLGINNVQFTDSDHAFTVMAHVGETQVWAVRNTFDFAHPFHLHGFFFQVLGGDGPLEWKDTVNIPVNATVHLAVRFDDRPGMWMFHCHILDHADAGMMGMLMLMPAEH